MRFFLDTEFIAERRNIELISIGIVSEAGHKFYAETTEYDIANFSEWHYQNVYPSLQFIDERVSDIARVENGINKAYGSYNFIGQHVKDWITHSNNGVLRQIEFWGWFCQTDFVLFCWLFGDSLIDLPSGWPQYCNDIRQELQFPYTIPDKIGVNHNALDDAIWHKSIFDVNRLG